MHWYFALKLYLIKQYLRMKITYHLMRQIDQKLLNQIALQHLITALINVYHFH